MSAIRCEGWWPFGVIGAANTFDGPNSQVTTVYIDGTTGYAGSGRSAANDDIVHQFDTGSMESTGYQFAPNETPQDVATFNGYGYSVGTGSGTVFKWDTDDMSQVNQSAIHSDKAFGLAFDSTYGYSIGDDMLVRKWDPATLNTTGDTFSHPDGNRIYGLDVDSTHGFSGGRGHTARKWHTSDLSATGDTYDTPHDILALKLDSNYVYAVGHDSSGVGGSDTTAVKLDKTDLSLVAEYTRTGDKSGYGVAVGSSHAYVATAGQKLLKLDKSDMSFVDEYTGFTDRAYTVDLGPNEGFAYASGWDGIVRKIDVDTMELA